MRLLGSQSLRPRGSAERKATAENKGLVCESPERRRGPEKYFGNGDVKLGNRRVILEVNAEVAEGAEFTSLGGVAVRRDGSRCRLPFAGATR